MLNLGMLQPECIYELPKENSTSLFQGFVDDVNQHPGFLEENSPTELVDPTARPGSTLGNFLYFLFQSCFRSDLYSFSNGQTVNVDQSNLL